MHHEDIGALVVEAAMGTLEPEKADEVWRHAGQCAACLDVAVTALRVRLALRGGREGAEGGSLVASGPHVPADVLAAWALGEGELAAAGLVEVARHLARCRTCREEAALVQAAAKRSRALDRFERWRSRWSPAALPAPALAVASLAVVALLLWPTVTLFVEREAARETAARLSGENEALRSRVGDLEREVASRRPGGAARLLVLRDELRGARQAPVIRPAAGGGPQPIVVLHPFDEWLAAEPAARTVVTLETSPAGIVRWREPFAVRELWDPEQKAAVLVLPAEVLAPGAYRLRFTPERGGPDRFAARFEVAPAGAR